MTCERLLLSVLASGLLAAGTHAHAATFQVVPVTIEAPAEAPVGVVTLTNTSSEAITLQVRVFRWTQVDGRDVLTPTRDVVASPPLVRAGAGAHQIVRVVRIGKQPARTEEAYRLLIDELPRAQPTGTGVQLLLRQSIPVFFGSSPKAASRLAWQVVPAATGWDLVASDAGERRARISEVEITDGTGKSRERRPGLVGYVLANSTSRWRLSSTDLALRSLKLTAASDAGAVRVDLGHSGP